MARTRIPTPAGPQRTGSIDGLAYTLWLPAQDPVAGLIVLHGAGSVKENHYDMGRAGRAYGFATVVFDQRGHGESEGALDGRMIDDVATIASLLDPRLPLTLRGSSMGGFVALMAAERLRCAGVVAICPASGQLLLRGLRRDAFDFRADRPALAALLADSDLGAVVARYRGALMLQHAEGDERVPVADSIALHERATAAARRQLVVLPGGHHRSIQHDAELQGLGLRFLTRIVEALKPPA